MSSPQILAVDVDQCLVDSATPWWGYMCDMVGKDIPLPRGEVVHYDLTKYFIGHYVAKYIPANLQGHSESFSQARRELSYFWEGDSIYDSMEPNHGAVRALQRVSEMGIDIVIVSHCKSGHFKNKSEWIEKNFPFLKYGENASFCATKEKHYIGLANWIVDDRNNNLNKFGPLTHRIRFDTIFTQEEPDSKKTEVLHTWDNLLEVMGYE